MPCCRPTLGLFAAQKPGQLGSPLSILAQRAPMGSPGPGTAFYAATAPVTSAPKRAMAASETTEAGWVPC